MTIRFSLDQLQVLEAIDRTGTFAKAAKELHRVPSAISYMIRTLEESLDLQLFDRSKHKAVLTPAGRRILEEGGELLKHARKMDDLAHQIQSGWEPELHVVIDGIVPLGPVTQALRSFRDEQIPTRLRLDIEYQEGVPDRWESDEADLMIILDFEDASDTLIRTALPKLTMLRLAAPDHPLAQLDSIKGDQLGAYMELVVRDSSPRHARSPKRGFGNAQHLTWLSDFHSKRLALLAGAGHGWMPLHLVEDDLHHGRLVQIHTSEPDEWTYSPELVHRKDRPLGRAGQRFVEILLASIKNSDD